MTSLEEAGELKALWRLLKIDLIHIKDLQILFETDSSNSPLDSCGKTSSGKSKFNYIRVVVTNSMYDRHIWISSGGCQEEEVPKVPKIEEIKTWPSQNQEVGQTPTNSKQSKIKV